MPDPTSPLPEPTSAHEPADESTAVATGPIPEPVQGADPVAELTKETAELKDKLLRALAEMENLRRRTEREIADARAYAITGFARDVLGAADNMRRALDALSPEARATAEPAAKSLIEGVELIERELLKAMEKHGVRRFDPQGEKFNPNVHQAMFEVPDATVTPGTVVQVVQAGYMLGDRVLRPALVGVAKGGPKPSPAGSEPRADDAGENEVSSAEQASRETA